MVKSISERISCEIWYLKAIAIFTIFFAHMPIDLGNPCIDVLKSLFDIIGMIGVPLFLFLSGYLYKEGKLKAIGNLFTQDENLFESFAIEDELYEALEALGYSQKEINSLVSKEEIRGFTSIEEAIKCVLKKVKY